MCHLNALQQIVLQPISNVLEIWEVQGKTKKAVPQLQHYGKSRW
jgi:hypothetical protein